MHNRTLPPPFKPVPAPVIPSSQKRILDNGVPLYWISIGDQEAIRIECIFPAENWTSPHPRESFFAIKMLMEGTRSRSSVQISQALDLYGAFTETVHTPDYFGISIYTMPRFLGNILPVVAEILDEASFPEKEWDNLINIVRQQLKVNLEQNSWLAASKFKSLLFGDHSRYGYSQNETDLNGIQLQDARNFYEGHIKTAPYLLFASGKVSDESVGLLEKYLGNRPLSPKTPATVPVLPATVPTGGPLRIEKPGSSQFTVRMGKRVPGRLHPDYFNMLVTNELLGGYFGSRLMKNIREEKGLTYGISSYLPALKDSAYFMIATDVNKEALTELSDEVRKELAALQTQPVSIQELEKVKNVMAGEFARSLGTAFEIGDLNQTTIICGLPEDFYANYLDRLRAVTVEDVQSTARQLFDADTLVEVIVG
ncbi:pitrilysin family protein [Ravibacter arvi]|uniref:Pitrilysin family protein n=1 Tax=Ravibacter arvi TaxID=2051041 RepID=A0ABP8LP29_9BACT